VNVVSQLENLMTYRLVQQKVFDGELNLMGLYFDIAHAQVQVYLPDERRFAGRGPRHGRLDDPQRRAAQGDSDGRRLAIRPYRAKRGRPRSVRGRPVSL
jgi:hypothetical protein